MEISPIAKTFSKPFTLLYLSTKILPVLLLSICGVVFILHPLIPVVHTVRSECICLPDCKMIEEGVISVRAFNSYSMLLLRRLFAILIMRLSHPGRILF